MDKAWNFSLDGHVLVCSGLEPSRKEVKNNIITFTFSTLILGLWWIYAGGFWKLHNLLDSPKPLWVCYSVTMCLDCISHCVFPLKYLVRLRYCPRYSVSQLYFWNVSQHQTILLRYESSLALDNMFLNYISQQYFSHVYFQWNIWSDSVTVFDIVLYIILTVFLTWNIWSVTVLDNGPAATVWASPPEASLYDIVYDISIFSWHTRCCGLYTRCFSLAATVWASPPGGLYLWYCFMMLFYDIGVLVDILGVMVCVLDA